MKKITSLALLAVAAGVVLAACGPTGDSSDNTSTNPPAPTTSSVEPPASSSEKPPVSSSEEPPVSSSEEPPVSSSEEPPVSSSEEPPVPTFPATEVATALQSIVPGTTTVIPALEGASAYAVDDTYLQSYGVLVVDCDFADPMTAALGYLADVEAAGYTFYQVDKYNFMWYISEDLDIFLEIGAYPDYVELYIEAAEGVYAEWPTDEIAGLVQELVPGAESTIPAYNNADLYSTSNGIAQAGAFTIDMVADDFEAAAAEYVTILEAAGWTYDSTDESDYDWYVNANEDIVIEVGASNADTFFQLYVEEYVGEQEPAQFPATEVAQALQSIVPGTETVVPALEGASEYQVNASYLSQGVLIVNCFFDDTITAAYGYWDTLEAAGYEMIGQDSYGYYVFLSPASDIYVEMGVAQTYIQLYIEAAPPVIAEWPTDEIAALVQKLVPGAQSTIPAYDGADSYEVQDGVSQVGAFIVNLTINSGEYEAAAAEYALILEAAGWTYDSTDSYGYDWYTNENQDIVIEVGASDDGEFFQLYIEAVPQVITEWPTEDLQELISLYFGDITIPAYEGFTNYEVVDFFDYFGVVFVYFDGDATLEGYKAILEDAGWTVTIDEQGYAVDPTKTIQIDFSVTNEGEPNQYFEMAISAYIDQSYNYEGTTWPGENVEKFLDEYCDGAEVSIPACEGTAYLSYLYDLYGMNLVIEVEGGDAAAYGELLVANGFTGGEAFEDYYSYSNESVAIDVDATTQASYGYISILIYPAA